MQESSRRLDPDFITILVLMVLGLIAYANSFVASFHYDDFRTIVENDAIYDLTNLGRIYAYCKGRFLTYLTLAVNYRISGFDTTSYHTFNFFIHYFAALFVYFLFIDIWKTPAMKGSESKFPLRVAGFLAAGIFLLHPLQTESVTYIIQRAESMAGMFYLGAIFFYVRARLSSSRFAASGYYVLTIICALGSAFSKEIAVTLPVMLVVYEMFFFNTSISALLRNKIIYLMFIPAGIAVFYLFGALIQKNFYYDPGTFTREQYLLSQLSVLLTYLRLFFWPANQNLDWDYPVAVTFFHVRTISSLFLLLLLMLLAVCVYKKFRLVSLGIIAFFITLAPTSSIIPTKDLLYEHRMYLAVAFLAMGCVHVLLYGLEQNKRLSARGGRIALILVIIALIPLLAHLTYVRNQVWESDFSLWWDVLQKSPNKDRPHINYGLLLYSRGWVDLKRVKKEFEIARELCPDCPTAYHHLGYIHQREGDYDGAVALYQEALERDPKYKAAIYHLSRLHKELKQWDSARFYLERLIEMRPGHKFLQAYVDLLEVYLELGLNRQAMKLAQKMARLPDGIARVDYYRGMAFYTLKDYESAKRYFVRQGERRLEQLQSCLMIGQIHYLEGQLDEAERMFRKVLEKNPWSIEAHYNLAIILEKRARFAEATQHLERVLVVDPFSIDTSVRLVILYNHLEDSSRRTELLRKLFGLKPNSPAHAYLRASEKQDMSRTLRGYKAKYLSGSPTTSSLEAKAIIATLNGDLREAIEYYQRYLQIMEDQNRKEIVEKEIRRLESLLRGEEMLRTPV